MAGKSEIAGRDEVLEKKTTLLRRRVDQGVEIKGRHVCCAECVRV
jgi:hypothetical protein